MTYLLVLAVVVGWLALSVLVAAGWILLRRRTIHRFQTLLLGGRGIRRVTCCDVCGQPFDDPLTAVWLPPMIVAHEDCARQLQLSGPSRGRSCPPVGRLAVLFGDTVEPDRHRSLLSTRPQGGG